MRLGMCTGACEVDASALRDVERTSEAANKMLTVISVNKYRDTRWNNALRSPPSVGTTSVYATTRPITLGKYDKEGNTRFLLV